MGCERTETPVPLSTGDARKSGEVSSRDARLVAVVWEDGPVDGERGLAEAQRFRDFLRTRNGVMTYRLVGHDNIG